MSSANTREQQPAFKPAAVLDVHVMGDDRTMYGLFDYLRDNDPVAWVEHPDYRPFWSLSRYDDIKRIGSENDRFLSAPRTVLVPAAFEEALLERGLALAEEMRATTPHGLRLSKQALNLNIDAQSLDAAMAIEDRQQVILSATEDHREALSAFIEKRAPEFRGR